MSERQIYEGNSASDHASQHNGNEYHNNQWYTYVVSPDYALPFVERPPKQRKSYPLPPQISCSKCTAKKIATEVHYHCSQCDGGTFNLCLTCYRSEKGCHYSLHRPKGVYVRDRWTRLPRLRDQWTMHSRRPSTIASHQQDGALPHILRARVFMATIDEKSFNEGEENHDVEHVWTLREGTFCDNCFKYCDGSSHDQYWNCRLCFGGAWGFCDSCVRTGQHCTHALYPLKHVRHLSSLSVPQTAFFEALHLPSLKYIHGTVNDICDECGYHLDPEAERYHCYKCLDGDFDMCKSCFSSMYQKENMPFGWREMRRCINGHEMAILDYKIVPFTSLMDGTYDADVRFTVEGPRSGWRGEASNDFFRCSAIYNYFPPNDGAAAGCLSFPRGAEIEEVTEADEGWMIGVYCGRQGRFPARYVLERSTGSMAKPALEIRAGDNQS